MQNNPQETTDFFKFSKETINRQSHFCAVITDQKRIKNPLHFLLDTNIGVRS